MSIFVIIVAALGMGLLFFLYRLQGAKVKTDVYEKKKFFFTSSERNFYDALKVAAGDKYVIFSKVRLSDLMRASDPKTLRILGKHDVDYVLCDAVNLTVLGAIYMTEQPQQDEKALKQRLFITQALEMAQIPTLRFKVQKAYDVDEIEKRLLASELVIASAGDTKEREEISFEEIANEEPQVEVLLTPMEATGELAQDKKLCPKCSSTMVLRKADKGRRAGSYFLMCSTYPACKRAEPVTNETVEQEDWGTGEVVSLS